MKDKRESCLCVEGIKWFCAIFLLTSFFIICQFFILRGVARGVYKKCEVINCTQHHEKICLFPNSCIEEYPTNMTMYVFGLRHPVKRYEIKCREPECCQLNKIYYCSKSSINGEKPDKIGNDWALSFIAIPIIFGMVLPLIIGVHFLKKKKETMSERTNFARIPLINH